MCMPVFGNNAGFPSSVITIFVKAIVQLCFVKMALCSLALTRSGHLPFSAAVVTLFTTYFNN
jgi:hypothetical protein